MPKKKALERMWGGKTDLRKLMLNLANFLRLRFTEFFVIYSAAAVVLSFLRIAYVFEAYFLFPAIFMAPGYALSNLFGFSVEGFLEKVAVYLALSLAFIVATWVFLYPIFPFFPVSTSLGTCAICLLIVSEYYTKLVGGKSL